MKNQEKKKNLFLTVILWVLFLPIMGTIVIWKNEKLKTSLKIVFTVLIWLLVIIIASANGNADNSDIPSPPTTSNQGENIQNTPNTDNSNNKNDTSNSNTNSNITNNDNTINGDSNNNTNNGNTKEEIVVYITPTGKRYHYSKSCAGKNAIETTLDDATASGKTACQSCSKN